MLSPAGFGRDIREPLDGHAGYRSSLEGTRASGDDSPNVYMNGRGSLMAMLAILSSRRRTMSAVSLPVACPPVNANAPTPCA